VCHFVSVRAQQRTLAQFKKAPIYGHFSNIRSCSSGYSVCDQ
jgi:hypothetical protein